MKFRVNPGQKIPRMFIDEATGKPKNDTLVGGMEVEGPPWWADEFAGRMTPLDESGNPVDPRALASLSQDLATAKAHEKVSILQDIMAKNPSLADALKPQLAQAEDEAAAAVADLEAKRAMRPTPQMGKPRPVAGPDTK